MFSVLHFRTTRPGRGFSLIEAAIVLGVVGLIMGAIWAGASSVYEKRQVAALMSMIMSTTAKFDEVYANLPPNGSTSSLNALMINSNLVPAEFIRGTGLVTPWGGTFDLRVDAYLSQNWRYLFYIHGDIPRGICVNLLRQMGAYSMTRPLSYGAANQLSTTPPGTFIILSPANALNHSTTYCGTTTSILFVLPRR